jgi:choline dehydrogenase-like flavoprotein
MLIPPRVQVAIIGSGAGGATTALELAAAGFEVLVLEEGGRWDLADYGAGSTAAMRKLYRRSGMTPIRGPAPIGYVEGCCVGGGTEINSGFWQRTPREILLGWKSRYALAEAGPEELAPHFAWAEAQLQVGKWGREWPPSTRLFARGIQAMGWSAEEIPRMARDCRGRNLCASGCPEAAKQGMSRAILPRAEAAGARIIPRARVKLLRKNRNRVTGLLVVHSRPGGAPEQKWIAADQVFVCAGPMETPALLRRSGITHQVGNSLRLHPMLKVVARFPEETHALHSVLPLLQVKEFWPDLTLGGAFFSLGHLALLLSENWPQNRELMQDHARLASFYVAVRSTAKGRVRPGCRGDDSTRIYCRLTETDLRNLSRGLARLSALLLAGGAEQIYPCVHGLRSISSETEAMRWMDQRLPKSALGLTTVHAFCSCPAGEKPDLCAADSFGRVYGFDNLFLNDASMLPDSPGVNPQGSIMALARRNALRFIERHRP